MKHPLTGQTVKYQTNVPGPNDSIKIEWVDAKVVSTDGEYFEIQTPKGLVTCNKTFIQTVRRIPEEDVKKFAEENMLHLEQLVADVIERMSIGSWFKQPPVQREDDGSLTIGHIIVTPIAEEYRRIGGFYESPCWQISYGISIPATRESPEDGDYVVVGTERSNYQAARLIVKTILDHCLNAVMESIDIEHTYASILDEY
jgi:hypothetical protein